MNKHNNGLLIWQFSLSFWYSEVHYAILWFAPLISVKFHFHFFCEVLLAAGLIINTLLSWNLGSLFDASDISVSNEEICSSDQGTLISKPSRWGLFHDTVHLRPLPPSWVLSGLDTRYHNLHSNGVFHLQEATAQQSTTRLILGI